MSLWRWQPDFMAISYSTKKIAFGPEVWFTCWKPVWGLYTNLYEQRFKNTLPQDGQSGSSHGSWALGDLCMNNHYTIRWNSESLIYLINNGHLFYKTQCVHLLKLWLSCVDCVSLHSCRIGPLILMIHSPTSPTHLWRVFVFSGCVSVSCACMPAKFCVQAQPIF